MLFFFTLQCLIKKLLLIRLRGGGQYRKPSRIDDGYPEILKSAGKFKL